MCLSHKFISSWYMILQTSKGDWKKISAHKDKNSLCFVYKIWGPKGEVITMKLHDQSDQTRIIIITKNEHVNPRLLYIWIWL